MAARARVDPAIRAWLGIPDTIERQLRGLRASALDRRGGTEQWSIRELAHHLVEANLIACTMVIAAVASSGCTFDWTWVQPNAAWRERAGYARVPIAPALAALRSAGRHVAALLAAHEDGLRREIRLFDAPGAPKYAKTVREILRDEVAHAREHLCDVPRILGRRRAR